MTASFSSTQQSLNDRINNLEMIIRAKDAELSRTAAEKEELNKTIYNLNKDLEQEQRTRSLRIDELKRELEQVCGVHVGFASLSSFVLCHLAISSKATGTNIEPKPCCDGGRCPWRCALAVVTRSDRFLLRGM